MIGHQSIHSFLTRRKPLSTSSERRHPFGRSLLAERPDDFRALVSDFGDSPAPPPTLFVENRAQHTIDGALQLGASVDADADGAVEDGVTFGTTGVVQLGATVTVTVTGGSGKLDAWIDFNGDGSWKWPGRAGVSVAGCRRRREQSAV